MKFQDDISNMNTYIHTYVHTYGQAETNMPPHFFKVGGIMRVRYVVLVHCLYNIILPKFSNTLKIFASITAILNKMALL